MRVLDDLEELQEENSKLLEIAQSFYEWTLINYPEDCDEYIEDVKLFKKLGGDVDEI